MLHILGFIIFLFIALFLASFIVIAVVLRRLLHWGKPRSGNGAGTNTGPNGNDASNEGRPHTYQYNNGRWERQNASAQPDRDTVTPEEGELHINRKKIFTKDEGEYVDFEEMKD